MMSTAIAWDGGNKLNSHLHFSERCLLSTEYSYIIILLSRRFIRKIIVTLILLCVATASSWQVGNPLDDSNFDFFDEDDNVPKYRGDNKIFRDF